MPWILYVKETSTGYLSFDTEEQANNFIDEAMGFQDTNWTHSEIEILELVKD
jgi:hypothetical protein